MPSNALCSRYSGGVEAVGFTFVGSRVCGEGRAGTVAGGGRAGCSELPAAAGLADYKSPSVGIVCGDFDGDNDTDVFVCSDARPNRYYINAGHGVFTQEAELQGAAFNSQGIAIGAMGGVAAGDLDNDGDRDL